jgi:hypothetical protein
MTRRCFAAVGMGIVCGVWGAAPANNTLTLRTVSVMDAPNRIGGEALRLLVPADWQFQGEVVWRNHPNYPASARLRTFNPNGVEEVGFMPNLLFYWNPYITAYFPIGSYYLGNEIRQPALEPSVALRTYVIPRYWPNLGAARVVGEQELPELATLGPLKYPDLKNTGTFRAGKVRLEFEEKGVPVQQDVYCMIVAFQAPAMGTMATFWGIDEIRYSKAEKGKLESQYKLLQAVSYSVKLNMEWFAKYVQVTQMMTQNAMNASNRAVDLSRYLARTNAQITSTIRQAYQDHEAAMDRINAQFDNYVRGVDNYRDPRSGSTVQLPSGYNQVWANANGEYVLSNDPNFNPNAHSGQDWQRVAKKQ